MTMAEKARVLTEHGRLYGRVWPQEVVMEASDPEHPLHDEFTWDDEVAGHRWRVREARAMIRAVRVSIKVEQHDQEVAVPLFISPRVDHGDGGGYLEISVDVRAQRALHKDAAAALREWVGRHLAVLTPDEVATCQTVANRLEVEALTDGRLKTAQVPAMV